MQELEAWYALAYAQVGARGALRLLEAFQGVEAALQAGPAAWSARAQFSPGACQRLQEARQRDSGGELARLAQLGITLVPLYDPAYPARLRAIADPPPALFVKGTLQPEDGRAIAIVGSRGASPYGRHVAAELAAELARRGITIVSGMALGADAAAHEGCLRAGGRTIAVLGSGIDVVYPPEHLHLYERIAASGAVVSEMPPGAPCTRKSFPIRNRIISGLCLGVVVVEAPEKSGALITATLAAEQGREVFAIPGSVNSAQSRGTHQLLRDGARLVESADDILEELSLQIAAPVLRQLPPRPGPRWDTSEEEPPPAPAAVRPAPKPTPAPPAPALPALAPEEDTILRLLSATAKQVDLLIEESALSPAQVNAALLTLELKCLVQRRPGNQYVRLR